MSIKSIHLFSLLLITASITLIPLAQATISSPTAVASLTDGVDGFDELDGAYGITTVTIGASTYALVASYNDDGVQIIDISSSTNETNVAPAITSLVVDDPDNADGRYSVGDTITITFDSDTNMPGGIATQNRTDINDMFTFSHPHKIGKAYDGLWTSPDTFTITLNHVINTMKPLLIGNSTVTPNEIIPILSFDETSSPSNSTSPVLTGDFGINP